nr:NTP transferase domain-containing protein [Hyphomonas sp. Mor2]
MVTATSLSSEHPEDVLGHLSSWLESGQNGALVFITATEGGAVRAPGALLAVSEKASLGYISGGCIDADVTLQARTALENGTPRSLRYGAGSPFVDLPLPCGGSIEVFIAPNPDPETIQKAHLLLASRQEIELIARPDGTVAIASETERPVGEDHVFVYRPKLRLRIAGRGADALALARIGESAGYATQLQLVDEEDIEDARGAGLSAVQQLVSPTDLPAANDDAWTAFVLLFHDQDWEVPLLRQALDGPAFYIGAVGSARTHANRCAALRAAGCADNDVAFVRGPIGLVPSLRDASMLAVSTLAEIVGAFPARSSSRRPRTALLMLAAGASSRFEAGDKLLAELDHLSILERAATHVPDDPDLTKIAVVPSGPTERKAVLDRLGWQTLENPRADLGQSTSLALGIEAIETDARIDQVIVLLADMPFVPASHIDNLRLSADIPSTSCVMSESNDVLSPPALFKRQHFEALRSLEGDRGAKAVFLAIEHGNATIALTPEQAADIDVTADLVRAKETVHA